MNVQKRLNGRIKRLLRDWTSEIDGDIPLKFADQLAAVLFTGALCHMAQYYYTLGVKHERRRRKQDASRRYIKKNAPPSGKGE